MEHVWIEVADHLLYIIIGLCVVIAIVTKGVTTIVTHGARERSRREIAAYIAEGSMTADQGERLLHAGDRHGRPA